MGACLALACAGVGMFWWQGRAEVENTAPPPPAVQESPRPETLPSADVAGLRGTAPPQATELTREEQRFFRYDRNRDWRITRNEMLSTRADAFRKLDSDGNNLLTFEEWAVATSTRFRAADANRNGNLTPDEFASTAPKAKAKSACTC